MTQSEQDVLVDQFEYHAPTERKVIRMQALREDAKRLALAIGHLVPPGADRSAAIRKIREALMTANAGIVLGAESWSDGPCDTIPGTAA